MLLPGRRSIPVTRIAIVNGLAAALHRVFWLMVFVELRSPTSELVIEDGLVQHQGPHGRRRLSREQVERVTWARGADVALRLKDGSWFKLPEPGHNSQSVANRLRAWLRASEGSVIHRPDD